MDSTALPGNLRLITLTIPTDYRRDDRLQGLIENWEDDTHARIRVRDVGCLTSSVTFGDLVVATVDERHEFGFQYLCERSRWNAFVARLTSKNHIQSIVERLTHYPQEAYLAAKIIPSPIGAILAVAIAKAWAQPLADNLDRMHAEGLLSEATWTVIR